jgi:uncharacterized protein
VSNSGAPTKGRMQPAMNSDTQFFWDAAAEGRLVIQRCTACGRLRHPPGPACPQCRSLDWDTLESSGRGTLYSYTVVYHPLAPGFDDPATVVVVELEEGVRVVSNLIEAEAAPLQIGEPLEVFFVAQDEGWTAPQFRRRRSA